MQEPIDSYDSPRQDKMISLIAWLIIASLLFYVIIFLFQGFLTKSPSMVVEQPIEENRPDDLPFIIETPAKVDSPVVVTGPVVSNDPVVTEVATTVQTAPVDDFFDQVVANRVQQTMFRNPVSEQGSTATPIVSAVRPVVRASSEVVRPVDAITPPPVVRTAPVQPAVAPAVPQERTIRVDPPFRNMREAFLRLKDVNFGELSAEFELLRSGNEYIALIRVAGSDSDSRRIATQLASANQSLGFAALSAEQWQALRRSESGVVSGSSTGSENLPDDAVASFRELSRQRPYTIQIGSFLSRQNAVALRDSMIQKNYLADVEEIQVSGKSQFRVLVGNYATKAAAGLSATELSERHELPVYVREAP